LGFNLPIDENVSTEFQHTTQYGRIENRHELDGEWDVEKPNYKDGYCKDDDVLPAFQKYTVGIHTNDVPIDSGRL